VSHDVVIYPFNRVADMRSNLGGRVGDLIHLYLDYFRARSSIGNSKNQHSEAQQAQMPAHRLSLLEFFGDLLSVLLVALKDF
jgi:hypothetical protein